MWGREVVVACTWGLALIFLRDIRYVRLGTRDHPLVYFAGDP